MDLVFTASKKMDEEPFTTDEVIAEFSGNSRESITRLIRRHKNRLEAFGKLGFEIRPSKSGQKMKIYRLNREQATLLITFLDNSAPVVEFKTELVRQFYAMEKELTERKIARSTGKETRHDLTDAIKFKELSPHYYKIYSDLVYKSSIGFTAKQLREARGVEGKSSPLDYLTAKELSAVNKRGQQIATLILLDMEYSEIKQRVKRLNIIYQTTLKTPAKSLQD